MAGSIEKRGKNSYRLVVEGGRDANGKRIKYTRSIKVSSKRAAEKELAKFVTEVESGHYIDPSKLTFSQFVDRWIRDYAEKNLSPKTVQGYSRLLESRILPEFGHIKIDQIKPINIIDFYTKVKEGGRLDGKPGTISDNTLNHYHRILSAILQDAVEWQILSYNPVSRIKPPRFKRKETPYYDEEQTSTLLQALESEPLKFKILVILALFTGLRRGELMGLEWKDIDFEKGTLSVLRSSQYVPGKGIITKEPKNKTSKRNITIPPSIIVLLKQYKSVQNEERLKTGDLWQYSGRLFVTWDGQPMHPDTPSRWFPKFLKRYNLDPLPFHGLRHTSATLLIAQGIPAKHISDRLGHANIATTMDIYGHSLQSADRESANRLEELYSTKLKKS